jgi:hypothetical protein
MWQPVRTRTLELSAADKQLLRELTERATPTGLTPPRACWAG